MFSDGMIKGLELKFCDLRCRLSFYPIFRSHIQEKSANKHTGSHNLNYTADTRQEQTACQSEYHL